MGIPIASADQTWLLMDRPNNLMHVHAILTFNQVPDWEALNDAIFERVAMRYRVLNQHPVHEHGHWEWEDDPSFSLENHLYRVVLEEYTQQSLHAHLSAQLSIPFDRDRPLWDMQLITGPDLQGEGVLLTRFHHALGDGIRLVQLLLGMCDAAEGAIPKAAGRKRYGRLETALHMAKHTVRDTVDYVRNAGSAAAGLPKALVTTMNPLQLPHHLETGFDLIRHPLKVSDALTSFASDNNELSNSMREVSRLLLHERAEIEAWSGRPSGEKAIDWVEGVSLGDIKIIAQAYDCTINDALVGVVSLAFTAYLRERGVREVDDIAWMMPVSLAPIDASLPSTLGNHFAVVLFDMPMGIDDPTRLMEEVHERTKRLKHSVEPVLAFGVQKVIAETPHAVSKAMTDFFANKTIGQFSNVPGPRAEIKLAGARIRSVMAWVPTSADQPIGICVFTYRGTVSFGVAVDTRMIPDPSRITALLYEHKDALLAAARERLGDGAA